jgi:hypothetical protein
MIFTCTEYPSNKAIFDAPCHGTVSILNDQDIKTKFLLIAMNDDEHKPL